jgi:hypothetical protein
MPMTIKWLSQRLKTMQRSVANYQADSAWMLDVCGFNHHLLCLLFFFVFSFSSRNLTVVFLLSDDPNANIIVVMCCACTCGKTA